MVQQELSDSCGMKHIRRADAELLSFRRDKSWHDCPAMTGLVVLSEVARVGLHLIYRRDSGLERPLELQHDDVRACQHNNIGASAVFQGEFVLEGDAPMN